MSHHFNSFLMNDVLIKLEEQSFFADIGEERTLRFVQDALTLSVHHDGNPGEALAGVGQRLGMCYFCWDRGTDLRQGICSDASMLSDCLRGSRSVGKQAPSIVPVLVYNGAPHTNR